MEVRSFNLSIHGLTNQIIAASAENQTATDFHIHKNQEIPFMALQKIIFNSGTLFVNDAEPTADQGK